MPVGSYIIVTKNKKENLKIQVGKLGEVTFKSGIYAYVGSAQGRNSTSLKHRVLRHIRSNLHYSDSSFLKPKIHWHIDYFLANSAVKIVNIIIIPSNIKNECQIAKLMKKFSTYGVLNFGSSDCKCKSHLFYISKENALFDIFV